MRKLLALLAMSAVILAFGACDSNSDNDLNDPISELNVFNNLTGAEIDGDSTITLEVGDTRTLRVMRTVDDGDTAPVTTNVTATSDWNVENTNVISVNETTGVVTATSAGESDLEIRFDDEDNDPTDDDSIHIQFIVTAAN